MIAHLTGIPYEPFTNTRERSHLPNAPEGGALAPPGVDHTAPRKRYCGPNGTTHPTATEGQLP